MAHDQVIAAIDVGTTKVSTLVGGPGKDGSLEIAGIGVSPSRGLKKGIVVDIEATVESIKNSLEKAERSSGFKIVSAYVGISGEHVSSLNNRGVVAVTRADRSITSEDVGRVIESAKAIAIPADREIIHIIPRSYAVDGQVGVTNPVGMHGFRLEVETHIVTAAVTSLQNLTKCINRAGIDVDDLILQPIASGEAVLTPEEREMGVMIADIGGGTTDISIFADGSVWHSSSLPVGGWHLTNDLSIALRVPFHVAEELKSAYGHAHAASISSSEMVEIPATAEEPAFKARRVEMAEVLQARVQDIIDMILVDVKRSGYDGMLPAGIVFTGGSANLRGIDTFARQYLGIPVRVGHPRGVRGMTDKLSDPAYATSVGLLLWGLRDVDPEMGATGGRRRPGTDLYQRLLGWAKEILPRS